MGYKKLSLDEEVKQDYQDYIDRQDYKILKETNNERKVQGTNTKPKRVSTKTVR